MKKPGEPKAFASIVAREATTSAIARYPIWGLCVTILQTNGTITALANPAPVPEPQKEAAVATFQSSASVSPKIFCSNTEDLSPDCVIASNVTVVRRQDLKVFEKALKARAASPSRLLASTAFSKNNNLQNVPTLADPYDSDAYTDLDFLSDPELDHPELDIGLPSHQ
ncbi:Hypothetical predicted protein [Pelobates cultripes]|uniref:Uncharacterized protein n=1 Tax=Pelobates cultripes TaxID=61616 RepID=A0AAD1WN86_PELCU|nr:Hypothetical predicted protein [Pelobates cultripes]